MRQVLRGSRVRVHCGDRRGWRAALRNRSILAVLSRGAPLGPELALLHREVGLPSLEPPVAPRWVTELSESLRFRLAYKWEFRMPRHINILETTVYMSTCKHCCIWPPDSRIPVLLELLADVALGLELLAEDCT